MIPTACFAEIFFYEPFINHCPLSIGQMAAQNRKNKQIITLIETPRTYLGYREGKKNALEVFDKDSNDFLGTVDIEEDTDGIFHLPIQIESPKEGYGTEAKYAVMKYVFERKGAGSIVAFISPDNAPSIKLHEKLGFQKTDKVERHLLEDKPSLAYVITKDKFEKEDPRFKVKGYQQFLPRNLNVNP
jgi:hypothetical protein